jgi:hypothetical protein
VLREEAGPVLPGDGRDQASRLVSDVRSSLRLHATHDLADVDVQRDVSHVVGDVQVPHVASSARDIAITEIPTQ